MMIVLVEGKLGKKLVGYRYIDLRNATEKRR